MADLHQALTSLAPVLWSDVPFDDLPNFLSETFAAGELICNSIPPPANGTPFHESRPHLDTPNLAKSLKEMHPSAARPFPPHKDHEELQKGWGKPIKLNAKDNPTDVAVYKMAGRDRHGAWFARRSVHEGLGFTKFKKAMQREFPQTMTVSGGPGAGAVRGLAADRRLERREVEGLGRVEVYQLSAQFPGPVTPRDFMTMLLSTDGALTDKSAAESETGDKYVPRHFMLLSRPVDHPDAPERAGYVRGKYESVELLREIPIHKAKAKSASDSPAAHEDGRTEIKAEQTGDSTRIQPPTGEDAGDPELNPVEWLMVTRSDPGGGIPRFLVDRGTPDAMLGDLHKFLNWACAMDEVPAPDEGIDDGKDQGKAVETKDETGGITATDGQREAESSPPAASDPIPEQSQGGILSNLTKTLQAGVMTYAPASVTEQITNYLGPQEPKPSHAEASSSSSDDDSSSLNSFMSAEELRRLSTAQEFQLPAAADSTDTLSVASIDSASLSKDQKKNLNHHEKEVLKLSHKRESLDRKLARKRAEEEHKLRKTVEKEQTDQDKAREKLEREMQRMEERHRREVEKLERRKDKETRKAEQRRQKKDDAGKLSLVARERDDFRGRAELLQRENALLRARVEELQRENTLVVGRLGKVGGEEAVRSVREELDPGRRSARSSDTQRSAESGLSRKEGRE